MQFKKLKQQRHWILIIRVSVQCTVRIQLSELRCIPLGRSLPGFRKWDKGKEAMRGGASDQSQHQKHVDGEAFGFGKARGTTTEDAPRQFLKWFNML